MCVASGFGGVESVVPIYLYSPIQLRKCIRIQNIDAAIYNRTEQGHLGPPTLIPEPVFLHLGPAQASQSMAKCL